METEPLSKLGPNMLKSLKYAALPLIVAILVPNGDCSTSCAQETDVVNQDKQASRLTTQRLEVQRPIKLNYWVGQPDNYESQEKWPVVLFLHGAGERGNDLELVKVHGPPKRIQQGHRFPFIMVAPQCPAGKWWEPTVLSALLDDIENRYRVDTDKIYVTGLSMGGFGTWELAAHSPNRFAAIAPICGGGDRFTIPFRIDKRIPTWIFHGAKDRVVPLSRSVEMFEAFEKRGADVKLTVYPNAGHDSWTATYDNPAFYQWLLSHSLSSR